MRGVVIHAPNDLRVEDIALAPLDPHGVRVRIAAGGICGSDLHYFHNGGFGAIRIKEPMVLGHEVAGVVDEVGTAVVGLTPGTPVAVHPGRPCGHCRYCREGLRMHCLDMRFFGSAMRFPHVQGAFREILAVDATQAIPLPSGMTMSEAAMAEPLAVALHAARQAGALLGRKVLVTGCGPIGALCVLVARRGGAAEVVATDVGPFPLSVARTMGATQTIDIAADPDGLAPFRADKGTFDVLFEASGTAAALSAGLDVLRPGGVAVQLGLGGDMTLPINTLVTKEIHLRGTFRFDVEFAQAVELMGKGVLDVKPLITATLPFEAAIDAFRLASDRSRAMKVQLAFGAG